MALNKHAPITELMSAPITYDTDENKAEKPNKKQINAVEVQNQYEALGKEGIDQGSDLAVKQVFT